MTVYLGKNPVGVGRIVEKKVAKEKFGATVDAFLGDVDADGNYVAPSEPVEINLAGVKSVPDYGFNHKFFNFNNLVMNASDVTSVGQYAFDTAFGMSAAVDSAFLSVSFDNLEIIDKTYAFYSACTKRTSSSNETRILFKKLKKITGNYAFSYFSSSIYANFDEMFPALEEISGTQVFYSAFKYAKNQIIALTKVKKIKASSKYYSVFGDINVHDTVWHFPNATEFTGYIWSTAFAGEIHFAAANQAAIEACEGYSYKWGFAGATIFFDL